MFKVKMYKWNHTCITWKKRCFRDSRGCFKVIYHVFFCQTFSNSVNGSDPKLNCKLVCVLKSTWVSLKWSGDIETHQVCVYFQRYRCRFIRNPIKSLFPWQRPLCSFRDEWCEMKVPQGCYDTQWSVCLSLTPVYTVVTVNTRKRA